MNRVHNYLKVYPPRLQHILWEYYHSHSMVDRWLHYFVRIYLWTNVVVADRRRRRLVLQSLTSRTVSMGNSNSGSIRGREICSKEPCRYKNHIFPIIFLRKTKPLKPSLIVCIDITWRPESNVRNINIHLSILI